MKKFTDADLIPWAGGKGLLAEQSELINKPLWWQLRGLSQTATGYGRKLTTSNLINFNGKLRRIYCTCFSNVGSCWFVAKGQKIFVN